MTTLLVDALIALMKTIDRGLTAVEKRASSPVNSPLTVERDAQPAGAGASAASGPGGHPIRSTSEILRHAANELWGVYEARTPEVVSDLLDEMRDRAACFAAHGD